MTGLQKNNNKENEVLLKHNTLVKARYNLGVEENRVFIYMMYKIQRNLTTNGMFCTISQDEFKKLVPNKNKNSIKGITNLLSNLNDNKIYFKKEKASKNKNIWGQYSFISGFEYDDELNEFKVECSSVVYDLLINHDYKNDGFYTPVNLLISLKLKNQNALRFYDFIRLWTNVKSIINYEVDELKEMMMLEDKYDKYNDFKKRILNPAIKELNETGYFEIDMKENKKGRKVSSIDFTVKDLDKRIYFEEKATESEILDIISNITRYENDDSEIDDVCIPDKKVFTAGTLRSFKLDFKDIDFKNKYMRNAFDEAVMIALDKDDVEKIKAASYKYFKSTLNNKIEEYKLEEIQDLQHKEEMNLNW